MTLAVSKLLTLMDYWVTWIYSILNVGKVHVVILPCEPHLVGGMTSIAGDNLESGSPLLKQN